MLMGAMAMPCPKDSIPSHPLGLTFFLFLCQISVYRNQRMLIHKQNGSRAITLFGFLTKFTESCELFYFYLFFLLFVAVLCLCVCGCEFTWEHVCMWLCVMLHV